MNSAQRTTKAKAIPLLENGDHLTIAEFERRYAAMPEKTKAELIWGIVYMSSPVRRGHGRPHMRLMGWLATYEALTPVCEGGDNLTLRLGVGLNQPQPDGCLYLLPEYGGQTRVDEEDYVEGGAELVAEVSASTATFDLHEKLRAYEINKVREYIVWRAEDRALDWFVLHGGKYRRLKLGSDGLYRSKVFPGLWLDPQALIEGNMTRVLQVVQEGLASAEHRRFVAKLQARKK